MYDPSPYLGCDVPPTDPPAAIPAEEQWQLFDPIPYIGCDVPPTDPPAEQVDEPYEVQELFKMIKKGIQEVLLDENKNKLED